VNKLFKGNGSPGLGVDQGEQQSWSNEKLFGRFQSPVKETS
jgi:hypothetical protein